MKNKNGAIIVNQNNSYIKQAATPTQMMAESSSIVHAKTKGLQMASNVLTSNAS